MEAARQIQLEKEQLEKNIDKQDGKARQWGVTRLLDIAHGDIGLALFIPFNWEAFEPLQQVVISQHSTNDSSDVDDMIIAPDDEIESCPPILSHAQMQEIHFKGLPATAQIMTWNRVYSLQRDGDLFNTMFEKCARYRHTLIVIQTAQGDVLGGYADTPWIHQKSSGLAKSKSFFGGGRAFLYATRPALSEEGELEQEQEECRQGKGSINFYPWTGDNDYSQICDFEKGSIGMGGGGAFGFYVQHDFTIGSSGSCHTFGNPPLTKNDGGSFEVVDFEVYGFSSMSDELSVSSRTSSFASVNSTFRSTSGKSLSSLLE